MPRKGAKGKWNLKMSPDEWYQKKDPWKIKHNNEEDLKSDLILGLINGGFVVDVGCGEGTLTTKYALALGTSSVDGCDISTIAIGRAIQKAPNVVFYVHDITKESLDGINHTVILSEVLYYIKPKLWHTVSKNIKYSLVKRGQFIISVGQYFTEADIRKIFPWCEFDKVFKLPSEKYEYNLIMSGRKK